MSDIVAVEESNTPHTNTKVTLVDITYCLENRVAQAIANKRSHYAPLRRALMNQGHDVSQVAVIVMCVCGSVPTSTLKALEDLGINRGPAESLLRKTHIAACEYMRRMCHTRRAIEVVKMGPQGIVSKLFQRDKPRRGLQPYTHLPGARPRRPRTN
jgi:hypothetical protein